MRHRYLPLISTLSLVFLLSAQALFGQSNNQQLKDIFEKYYQQTLKFDPLSATFSGDHRYDDQLVNDGTIVYKQEKDAFSKKVLMELSDINRSSLTTADRISFDVLKEMLNMDIESRKYHLEYMPVNQFSCLPLLIGQLGSGRSAQPFKTVLDYENWLKRIMAFRIWTDTAIQNMRKGVSKGIVLPKALVLKVIPQFKELAETDSSKNQFFYPIRNFPKSFTDLEKSRLTLAYKRAVNDELILAYRNLADFLKNDYLKFASDSAGLSGIPGGSKIYDYYVKLHTTTDMSSEDIYQQGLNEVARIRSEVEKVMTVTGFRGSVNDFFAYLLTNRRFMPFKTAEEVLKAYSDIYLKVRPHLSKFFYSFPKTKFEIRRVEAYREASQNGPSYLTGSFSDNRPGILYIPVPDATKINVTFLGLEATFLHEGIPGHHFQISLQQENTALPNFRKQISFNAFTEGWGLYVESLGKKLGCYTDPYQQMGALNNELHRAIRLVTDVGIHTGKMTREEAIAYMVKNEPISEADATLSAERYMAMPGQALSYKIGEMEIIRIREKCKKTLGKKFDMRKFHDALLKQGDMPLNILNNYMEEWCKGIK